MTNNKRARIALAVLVAAAALGAYALYRQRSAGKDHVLRVSGNIEVTEAEVSFRIAGRVDQRLVDEGQSVRSGDLVAVLDSADLTAEAAMNRAALGVAQAALAELEAGSRPQEIAAAEATVARTKADAVRAEVDLRRFTELLRTNVIAPQEFDAARAASEAATARWRESEEQAKLVKEGPRREAIDQARARADQARQALALSEIRLGYATLRAPLSGFVLSKNIEPGEYVLPGTPVVTVGDLERPWVRAYVDETDLGRVKLGQAVRVTTDSYPGKVYDGHVSFISSEAEFTPKSVQTAKERVKLVYRIKVEIANPRGELKPGMPADAEILLP